MLQNGKIGCNIKSMQFDFEILNPNMLGEIINGN